MSADSLGRRTGSYLVQPHGVMAVQILEILVFIPESSIIWTGFKTLWVKMMQMIVLAAAVRIMEHALMDSSHTTVYVHKITLDNTANVWLFLMIFS